MIQCGIYILLFSYRTYAFFGEATSHKTHTQLSVKVGLSFVNDEKKVGKAMRPNYSKPPYSEVQSPWFMINSECL